MQSRVEPCEWEGDESGFSAAWAILPAASSQDTHVGGGALTDAAGGASTSGVFGNLICKAMTAMWKVIW